MKVVVCPCGARNTAGGQCILCGQQLGSVPRAVVAGAVAALVLAVAWAVWFWLTGFVWLWLSLLFGVVVSGAVVLVSFGRGWVFQAIASAWTLVGIVAAETLLVLLQQVAPNDPWVFVFGVCGVMGGFWVWKQPSESEDG